MIYILTDEEMMLELARREVAMVLKKEKDEVTRDDVLVYVGFLECEDYTALHDKLGPEGTAQFFNAKYAADLLKEKDD